MTRRHLFAALAAAPVAASAAPIAPTITTYKLGFPVAAPVTAAPIITTYKLGFPVSKEMLDADRWWYDSGSPITPPPLTLRALDVRTGLLARRYEIHFFRLTERLDGYLCDLGMRCAASAEFRIFDLWFSSVRYACEGCANAFVADPHPIYEPALKYRDSNSGCGLITG